MNVTIAEENKQRLGVLCQFLVLSRYQAAHCQPLVFFIQPEKLHCLFMQPILFSWPLLRRCYVHSCCCGGGGFVYKLNDTAPSAAAAVGK